MSKKPTPEAVDPGPPERAQHHVIVAEETGIRAGEVRFKNATATPLDAYFHRGLIERHQWQGGDILRTNFELAGMSQGVTGSLQPSYGGEKDFTYAQLRARSEVNGAIQRLGRVGSAVALNVCCYGYTVSAVDKGYGWRRGYAMIRLREALDELAYMTGAARREEDLMLKPMRIRAERGLHMGVAPLAARST